MTVAARRRGASWLAAAGLALVLAAHPALLPRSALAGPVTAAVLLGAATLCLAGRWQPGRGARPAPFPWLPAAAYLLAATASVLASPAPALRLLDPLGQLGLLWLGWWLAPEPRARRQLAVAAVAGAAACGLYGVAQHAGLDPLPRPGDFADRVLAVFANPNHLGDFAAAALPLALAAYLWPALSPGSARAPARGRLRLAAAGGVYAGLLLAGSRGAWWAGGAGALALAAGLLL
ncbi:MAG: hypothetical protein ABIL09_16570, partial [Gemmatimonadota bacterium]